MPERFGSSSVAEGAGLLKLLRLDEPECLARGVEKWTYELLEARRDDPRAKFKWRSEPCRRAIAATLCEMTGDRCSYCDGPLDRESRKTVDHFRPKETFAHLAYHWDNFFACCDKCQSEKGKKFHEWLLKPDEAEYQFDRYFLLNYESGAVEPAPEACAEDQQRAAYTLQLLGLNSEARKRARLNELAHFSRDPEPDLQLYSYRYFLS